MTEEPRQHYIAGFIIMDTETKQLIYNPEGGIFKSEEEAIAHIQPLMITANPYRYILVPANDSVSLN